MFLIVPDALYTYLGAHVRVPIADAENCPATLLTAPSFAVGTPPVNILINGNLEGCTDCDEELVIGWHAHNAVLSVVDYEGRTGVVSVADNGGGSDMYQTARTIPGETYDVTFDVWADHIENRGEEGFCETSDQNGILDIREGFDTIGNGAQRLCPTVAAQWTTVSGSHTATSSATTFALHSEATWTAYFDNVVVSGPPPPPGLPEGCDGEEVINRLLTGPVVDNQIPGWNTYHAALEIGPWPIDGPGRDKVLKASDAGSFSEIHQTVRTQVGGSYTISFDVWADPISNTAGRDDCSTTDSNGLLDIREGAGQVERHGEMRLCPDVAAEWTTVTGVYVATNRQTTFALHSEGP